MGTDVKGKTLEELSDEELMAAFANDNEESFLVLYQRYGGRVLGYLRRKLINDSTAEEVFQEVFLRVTRARSSFNSSYKFAPWLFSIVHRCLIDSIRLSSKKARLESELEFQGALQIELANLSTTEIDCILGALTERDREVLTLRYVEDLSFDSVATRLGMNVANIRQIASRAIRKLRKEYL